MTPVQIILLGLLTVIACVVGWVFFSWHYSNKNAMKFDVLGTVVGWQNVKVPLLGRAIIQYTKKGKPMQAQTNLMLRSRKPKQGMKRMWTVFAYQVSGKPTFYIARKKK